jgi:hypothetical protein
VRRLAFISALAALAFGVLAPAALGAGWAKLSPDDVSGIDQAAVVTQGARVVAAWPSGSGTDLAGSIAFRGFAPTPTASLAGASPVGTAAGGFTNVSQRPGLVVVPSGLHVVTGGTIAGQDRTHLTPPLTEGTPGAAPTVIATQLVGALDAVALPDGGIIVANMENGAVHAFRDAVPADGFDVQALIGGGCCSYHPALARDGAGNVWLAWYSNATGKVGIFLVRLDPATAAPIGSPVKAPQSESPANNGFHLALACSPVAAGGCRIVYAAQPTAIAPLRIASWASGEAGPTTIVTRTLSLGIPLTASYRADGKLWVAWYEPGISTGADGYFALLGNAKGAGGGTPQKLGRPGGFVQGLDLESTPLGDNLVLVGTVVTGKPRAALWTTVVQPPDQVIENPRTIRNGPARVVAPRGVSLKNLKKTKCVRVRVTVTEPARVQVVIFSGTKSIRVFGQTTVSFAAAGTKVVCVRVPFRAKTFDARTPAKIAIGVRRGARARAGEPKATVVTKGFRFQG